MQTMLWMSIYEIYMNLHYVFIIKYHQWERVILHILINSFKHVNKAYEIVLYDMLISEKKNIIGVV